LYYRGKENRVNILKSIDEGLYKMGTFRETLAESTEGTPQFGPEQLRVYSDLNSEEKDRYNADIWATNILLQGLPKDIYTLINHYTDAKDIWDNVKMLIEGSELTKEDRESQLYDDFEHFRQHKGESIHEYYVRFAKLINDGIYVTAVKLNRGLRDSNYDQLYAYLKQHKTHAKENKIILKRFSQPTVDPLALLSSVSNPQHYSPSSSASSSTQVPPPLAESSSPAEDLIENLTNTLALLTQSYRTFLPQTNNQLRTSSNARNHATGGNAAGYEGAPNRVGNDNQGQARPGQARTVKCYNCNGTGHIARNCTQPKRPQNSEYFKDKMLLMQVQENGVALDAEQLLFLAGGQDNADDYDAFDSDVDEAPTAQTMFMANLSSADPVTDKVGPSYDSDILSEHALYNGNEIIKDNHTPAIVHSSEDTLEITKITRKKMNDKMNDPECVTRKSNDLMKLKSKALKERTKVSRPIKAFTVYPQNTPATLVPKVLPTKSQVKIHIFTLIQLFLEFDKTCKKRITPTRLTDGKRGFEQTKACYLQEVIPLFKTLKDNFEGIQKALTKEVKEMKDVFEELEAVVSQYVVDRKHKMRLDVITVGLTMRISLLYHGEYSQWIERFMNYLEEQTNMEAMINYIKNDEHPLPVVAQVSLAGTAPNTPSTLKDPKFWTAEEKKTRKIDRLERSLLIQGLLNDIYSLINSNDTAKDLWDTLERQMRGFEYVINDLKRCSYKKDNSNQGDVNDVMGYKKKVVVVTSDPLALVAEKTKVSKRKEKVVVQSESEGSDDEDISDLKKITALLAKAFNRKKYYAKPTNNNLRTSSASSTANKKPEYVKSKEKKEDKKANEKKRDMSKMESISDSNQEINANMVFMAKMEKVLSDSEESSSSAEETIIEIYLWIIDSGCSKHMTGNRALLTNFVEKFIGTVRFDNNDFAVIPGYGDVVIGSMIINKVYYVKGLGHNLFSVGQFCDKGLEVAFRESTCFVRNKDGVDLSTDDRSLNLYTIALNDITSNSSACILAKTSSSQSWLWHQRKIHQKHHKSKTDFALNKPLYLLHMDLCGPMRVESINGNRYVLVVVDDYSRYTWVFFLYSKDEASKVIISFIKKTQVNLQLQVRRVRTDNGTEFKNKTLAKLFDEVRITQQFSGARTLQQNGIVERMNRTLVEATRTMLTFANLPLCYLLNDYDDVEKLKEKEDIRVFVGYLKESASFRIYNKRTRKIHVSVNVNFDEISKMASKQFSLKLGLSNLNETGKSSNPTVSQVSEISKKDLENLFYNFYNEYFDYSKITNVETSNNEIPLHEGEVFHEVSKSFQEEYSSYSLNDDV
nr:hypothetical protein [Tanacetum cinerariifolium]